MLQNSTPCSVMEQMFVIENHMFCNIRLQTSNMPETRFCCGGVAGRLREHRFWWGFCFQNSEFGCWTRRRISWSSNGSHGLSKHECCRSTQRPWPSQVCLLMYSCHMPLYGTECLVEYGTMWRHGSSPTKLSCGGVAGTLREQGIWLPAHCFSKLIYWGFAARPFGRQARDRRQFKNHGFSVAGTNFLCKTMCFLLREQKGLPATVKKPWFFCCGKKWVF